MTSLIYPVVMCGGSGKRLWPLSRSATPKQFLALTSERTMFQETLLRLRLEARESKDRFAAPIIIANRDHAPTIETQLQAAGLPTGAIILEPMGRNTAPAAAAAALWVQRSDPAGLILLLPADHFISQITAFHDCIERAAAAARAGFIATFGITPAKPETGYGYIEQGDKIDGLRGAFKVARFVEKPNLADAERFLASGRFTWNSGMFLFRSDTMIAEMKQHCPAILERTAAALPANADADHRVVLDAARFADVPNEAVDTAVMERTSKAAVIPASIGWSDVGSFAALWETGTRDESGNLAAGDVSLRKAANTYVRADSRFVAAIGVEDLVIVETADAVLIAKRSEVQDIKPLVDSLEKSGRHALLGSAPPARTTWLEVAEGQPARLNLGLNETAYLIVIKGKVSVTDSAQSRRAGRSETVSLPAGWNGTVAAVDSERARCLLVALVES